MTSPPTTLLENIDVVLVIQFLEMNMPPSSQLSPLKKRHKKSLYMGLRSKKKTEGPYTTC